MFFLKLPSSEFLDRYNLKLWTFLFPVIYFIKVHGKRTDFPCYYKAGSRFFNSENLYYLTDQWPYKYPPSAAFFFQPLSFFSPDIALFLFYSLSFIAMACTYILILNLLFQNSEYERKFLIIPFLLNLRFHFYDFANMQINSIMLFLLIMSFTLFIKDRPKKGALLFSVAGIFKVIPLFLSFYFLLKKKFHYFFWVLALIVFNLILPIPYYGLSGYKSLINNYFSLMDASHSLYSQNRILQSLPSMISKSTSSIPFFTNDMHKHYLLILVLLAVIAPFFVMLKRNKKKTKLDILEFSYCLLFYPLVNPVGWRHSHIFIIPAVVISFFYIYKEKLYIRLKYKMLICAYLVLNVFSSKFIAGAKLSHASDHLSFNVIALFVLFYAIFSIHKNLYNIETI